MRIALWLLVLLPSATWALSCSFRSHEALGRMVLAQVQNLNCPQKRVHLTFDDGPHPTITPLLLNELNLRSVKATFFVSASNIPPTHTAQRNIVKSAMDSGHTIGSHGLEHEAYDLRMSGDGQVLGSLSEAEQLRQIRLSTQFLNESTANRYARQRPLLFRFPFGRGALPSDAELDEMERRRRIRFSASDRITRLREYRTNSAPLHEIAEAGYGHLLWNHDSRDSTSNAPGDTPEAKANFIHQNLASLCSSQNTDIVSLFHDIKPFNPEVVAVLIDLGRCLGMSFVDSRTILSANSLRTAGTYIPRESIQAAPVRQVDKIAELLRNIKPGCDPDTNTPGSCYSQDLNRYFSDCQSGEVSICIRGEWYRKTEEKIRECHSRGL